MLGRELPEPFFVGLVVACLATIVLIRGLERRLPVAANRITSDEPPPDEEAEKERILTV
jgi:hypothetical protein